MEFILASSNSHKAQEFNEFCKSSNLIVNSSSENIPVEETGESFRENAFLKAHAYYSKFKKPVLSDDSGLVVLSLPGELGIYSARFGGPSLTDKQRSELLLDKMKGKIDRSAYFVCYLCFYVSPEEIYYFEGRLNGHIGEKYIGSGGFGYDPVFIPNRTGVQESRLTLAELVDWKSEHSHRAQAFQQARKFFMAKV